MRKLRISTYLQGSSSAWKATRPAPPIALLGGEPDELQPKQVSKEEEAVGDRELAGGLAT